MKKHIKLNALISLLFFSTAATAEMSLTVGMGEYKNKQPTASLILDLNTKSAGGSRPWSMYLASQLNSVKAAYALHNSEEILFGVGVSVTHGLDAEVLLNGDTYKGLIKTKLSFPSNQSLYGLAQVSHRNRYRGGLKRTQASAGLGWIISKKTAIEIIYQTGNFHSDFVSDQLMLGITWN